MADRAVLIERETQIVERGRHDARAKEFFVTPGRLAWHSRHTSRTSLRVSIRGFTDPWGSWQGRASLISHGRMFKRKRPALIAMALDAARFVRSETLAHGPARGTVGIMAIDARHCVLGNLVAVRASETAPSRRGGSRRKAVDLLGVRATRPTGPLAWILWQATHETESFMWLLWIASRLGRLVQVACQADLVRLLGNQFRGILNFVWRRRAGMFGSRPVAGFAGMAASMRFAHPFPTTLCGLLQKAIVEIFVAGLAGFRSRVFVAELCGAFGSALDRPAQCGPKEERRNRQQAGSCGAG